MTDKTYDRVHKYETSADPRSVTHYAGPLAQGDSIVLQASDRQSEPIRVAHLHSSNGIYGAERWTATQVRHLDSRSVHALIITVGAKLGSKLFHEMLIERGIPAEHITLPGKLNLKIVTSLRRMLLRRRIEILHTHGFKSDILGYLATRSTHIKLVATPHGWSADEGLRIRFYELVSRSFLRHFDCIYPLSQALLEDFRRRRFPDRRLRLVLNAVDAEAFEECFNTRQPRQPGDPFNILFVGRLFRPKGVFELLDAFARLKVQCPAEIRFVGAGPERAALARRCEELGIRANARFVGEVSDVVPHLAWSSVLVLPSYSEGIPRTVMEAFCAGVPVIGTSIPGIRALITDQVTGRLVPLADVAALARALEGIAANPKAAEGMAANARQYILAHHSADRHAREFEQEYRRLACRDGCRYSKSSD